MLAAIIIALLPFAQASDSGAIPASERAALVELFEATSGPNWKNRTGWLGPAGTECSWYGVACTYGHAEPRVMSISLMGNGLIGAIPASLATMSDLQMLAVQSNKIKRPFPESLLQRWDAGTLDFRFGSDFSTVTEIRLDYSTSALCADEFITMRRDGSIETKRELCRTQSRGEPKTFCEVRRGNTLDYDRVARFLEIHGFFEPQPAAEWRAIWVDVPITTISATRDGKVTSREIGFRGSGSLVDWAFEAIIRGTAEKADWKSVTSNRDCR